MLQIRKGGLYPRAHEIPCDSVKQGLFSTARIGQGVHGGGVVNASLHLLIMKCVHHSREKAKVRGKMSQAAVSFP